MIKEGLDGKVEWVLGKDGRGSGQRKRVWAIKKVWAKMEGGLGKEIEANT